MDHPHTYLGDSGANAVPLYMSRDERMAHAALLGATGAGKSNLLRHLALQDIERGDGILYLDPHGDDAEALLDCIPAWRHNHVCYFNAGDLEYPIAFNVLADTHPDDRARAADALVSALRDIWFESWGPRMETILRHSALALLEVPKGSIAMIPRLLTDDTFRRAIVPRLSNTLTRAFFERRFEEWRDAYRDEAIEPVLNKIDSILSFPSLLYSLGQDRSTLHLERAMQHGRIVIANLGRGVIGDTGAGLLGALLLARARTAAMTRAAMPVHERRDFHILIDEAQTIATNSLPSALAELRKYSVSVVFATQILAGLSERTRAALLGTVSATVAFRLGPDDATVIAPKYDGLHRTFNVNALNQLARGEAFAKIGADDVRRLICPPPSPGRGSAETVRKQSRRHYGRPREDVHEYIERQLNGPSTT